MEKQIIHILKDVSSGLAHMHAKGVQHRDIKVENILLDTESKAFRLCDFGSANKGIADHATMSANELDDAIETYERFTTMMYRPPEMIDRFLQFRVDTQADVWMFGCVAFSLAFGFHPFQDAQKIGILNCQYFMPKQE